MARKRAVGGACVRVCVCVCVCVCACGLEGGWENEMHETIEALGVG